MKAVIAAELHRQARRNYPRRFVDVRGLDETWQADLVDMTAYSSHNKGYKYLLTIIDIFSKYAWAVPIKSKSGKDVTAAMKSVLTQSRYSPNWTTEIFTVSEVKDTNPPTYKLTDYQDHPIEGGFYEEELGKIKYPDAQWSESPNSWPKLITQIFLSENC
ncbi:uncharacterized protein [Neodiprion pinetum]|uniref:uncharacterized protein n=1 Tax=Neodiprion pinetum TaxID=441929 RepID=UPI0037214DE2